MGKSIICIVLYFGIVSILLPEIYTASIDNGNINSDSPTIMDKIKSDDSLCPPVRNLLLSNLTKKCATIKYPEKPDELNLEQIDTLLCLGVYDAWHKYCYYNSLKKGHTYNDVSEFDTALQKYIPSYDKVKVKEKKEEFCKSLVGLKSSSSSNTTLMKLSKFLNNPEICSTICFNIEDGTFRKPLCAVMAWSNELDNNNSVSETQQDLPSGKNKKPDLVSPAEKTNKEEKIKQPSKDNNGGSDVPVNDKNSADKLKTTQTEHTAKEALKSDEQPAHPPGNDNQENEKTSSAASSPDALKPSTEKKLPQPENNVQEQVEDPQPAEARPDDTKNNNEAVDPNANNSQEEEHTDDKKSNDAAVKSPGALDNTHGHEETESEDYDNHPGRVPEQFDQDDETLIDTDVEISENNENDPKKGMQKSFGNQNPSLVISRYPNIKTDEESHFYTYFTVMCVISILGYVGYHHKQKILAILLEGRRTRGNRGRRRPSTASYRKLDCTLEEAVTSQCNANVTHVIY